MSSAITDSTTKKVVIGYNTVTIQDKNFTSNAGVGQQYTEAQILNKVYGFVALNNDNLILRLRGFNGSSEFF